MNSFEKHGVGVISGGIVPNWWGGKEGVTGHMAEMRPISLYEEALKKYKDHPAIIGIDIGDEPSALDFAHYGKVAKFVGGVRPDKFVYLNLFPNYAFPDPSATASANELLGAPDYQTYIADYCRHFPLDYICFDSYIWGWGNTPSVLNENLRIVGDACTGSGRSLWVVLQVNSYKPKNGPLQGPMTENMLRYQANTALAFGAETIIWACWQKGWWECNVLDTNGVKTVMYERLQRVNSELRNFGGEYMKYRRVFTEFVCMDKGPDGLKNVGQWAVKASNGPYFRAIRTTDSSPLVVGHFLARDGQGGHAFVAAAQDDPHDRGGKRHLLVFRAGEGMVRAYGGEGEIELRPAVDGVYTLELRSNRVVLVTERR